MLARMLLTALVFSSAASNADFINFEGYAPAAQLGTYTITDFPMVQGDFYLYSLNSVIWSGASFYVQHGIYPDSGSDWLVANSIGIDPIGGGTFSLVSADISETFYFRHPTNNVLTYMLITEDDQFVEGVIDLDEIFGFETVQFGSTFSNIRQLIISADAYFVIDNIVLTREVSAPDSIALLD